MPLTSTEHRLIEQCTNHFFSNLPITKVELQAKIDDFKNAILNRLDERHELFYFQECFYKPLCNLRGINIYNSDFTIGEAQSYLFSYTEMVLKNAVKEARLEWDEFDWKSNELLETIKSAAQYQQKFTTVPLAVDGGEHYYFIEPENRIFKARLNPLMNFQLVQLIITMAIEEKEVITVHLRDFPNNDYTDDGARFERFMKSLVSGCDLYLMSKPQTNDHKISYENNLYLYREKWHGKFIYFYYIEKDKKREKHILLKRNQSFPLLAQTRFNSSEDNFIKCIDDKITKEVLAITSERNHTFLSPAEKIAEIEAKQFALANLIKQKIIRLTGKNEASEFAKILLTYQYYYDLIKNKIIPFRLISNIDAVQFKTLTTPAIIERLEKNKYTIQEALRFTAAERDILLHHFYNDQINLGKFIFERDFRGLSDADSFNLRFPATVHLLKAELIDIREARGLSAGGRLMIANEFIAHLIETKSLDFNLIQTIDKKLAQKLLKLNGLTAHAVNLLVRNPYIFHFVDRGILQISELNHIPLNPHYSSNADLDSLNDLSDLNPQQIRAALVNFIDHAKHHLLDESDMGTIYHHLPELCELNAELDILSQDDLYANCRIKIVHRLNHLLVNTPLKLVDGNEDSFSQLIASCNHFHINFNSILDDEIERRIRVFLMQWDSTSLDEIRMHQNSLGLSNLHFQELYFTQRLLGIYEHRKYCINDRKESVAHIIHDIHETCREQHIPIAYLRVAITRRLLPRISKNIKNNFDVRKPETPNLFKKIVKVVTDTNITAKQLHVETDRLKCWKNAFQEILTIINEEKPALEIDNYRDLDAQRSTKKQRNALNFFTAVPSKTSPIAIKHFCDRIEEIATAIGFETRMENNHERSLGT